MASRFRLDYASPLAVPPDEVTLTPELLSASRKVSKLEKDL